MFSKIKYSNFFDYYRLVITNIENEKILRHIIDQLMSLKAPKHIEMFAHVILICFKPVCAICFLVVRILLFIERLIVSFCKLYMKCTWSFDIFNTLLFNIELGKCELTPSFFPLLPCSLLLLLVCVFTFTFRVASFVIKCVVGCY